MDELKEKLYVTAINNLMKKNEFLLLCSDLDMKVINEEQFEEELTTNSGKYQIVLDQPFDKETFFAVNSIIDQLEFGDFNVSDIEELFSIKDKAMYKYMVENTNLN